MALILNYLGLLFMAVSGVIINTCIAVYYGPTVLGSFNIVYAIYIFSSQFAVLGIHYSVLRAGALTNSKSKYSRIIMSAIVCVCCSSITVSSFLYAIAPSITSLYQSNFVQIGVISICPAIIFFAVNKVMQASLNAQKHMCLLAASQIMRYCLLVIFMAYVIYFKLSADTLCTMFLFSESLVSIFLVQSLTQFCGLSLTLKCISLWVQHHFKFGIKACMTGMLIELNSRVDVLLLGYWLDHSLVGIYSFATMFVEGVYHGLVVLRNFANPELAQALRQLDLSKVSLIVKQYSKLGYILAALCIPIIIALYPILTSLSIFQTYSKGLYVIILEGAILLSVAGYIPFEAILTQGNYPKQQSINSLVMFISNFLLNALIIPVYGIIGCAVAMAFSTFLLSVLLNCISSARYLNVNLLKIISADSFNESKLGNV